MGQRWANAADLKQLWLELAADTRWRILITIPRSMQILILGSLSSEVCNMQACLGL